MLNNKLGVAFFVVILFHLIGLIGLLGEQPGFFIRNTPLNLLLSACFLFWLHRGWNIKQILVIMFIGLAGYAMEVVGVNTGYLFGDYYYGKTLGIKVFNVPVLISVNWMMLIYITGNLSEQIPVNIHYKAIIGSFLMVFIDFFIEPVAMRFDYWQWENNYIPLTNYICWYIISFLFLSLYLKAGFRPYNPMSGLLYMLQLLMFVILGLAH